MARRPKPVRDMEDAVTWLSFIARFCEGEVARNAAGTLNVLLRCDCENVELRDRLVAMAKVNEIREARGGEGL